MAASGMLRPGYDPEYQNQKRARQKAIAARRSVENKKLTLANKKSRNAALKKKGSQKYKYQQIQGTPDFGLGEAGPGIPYSVKSWTLPEKQSAPKKTAKSPPKTPKWLAGAPLWWASGNIPTSLQKDWRLAAIRRRLGNA